MKFAFSTLGCPAWDLATAIARAKEYGYDGVDIRTLCNTNRIFDLDEFSSTVSESVTLIEKSGVEITCFSSSVKAFAAGDELKGYTNELSGYLELCRIFGVKSIRIFGGGIGETPRDEAIGLVVDNCRRFVEQASPYGVKLLFETHDSWTDGTHVRQVMESVDSRLLGVVWDVAHPYRYSREKPEDTQDRLGAWIANTHWKDAYPADPTAEISDDFRLCLVGDGVLPLKDFVGVLKAGGYDGYYTLEWEKMWHPYLDEPEVAFPQYIQYMKSLGEV